MSEHTSEKEQNEKQNELTSHGTKVQAKPDPKEELDDLPELDELDEEEQKEFGKMTSFITREVMEKYSGPLPHPKFYLAMNRFYLVLQIESQQWPKESKSIVIICKKR